MTFRSLLLASAALAATFGVAAAADLPTQVAPPAPIPYAPALMNWGGFYAGVNAGAVWAATGETHSYQLVDPNTLASLQTFSSGRTTSNGDGFIGGGQAGYNFQAGNWVFGAETDFTGLDASPNTRTTTVYSTPWISGFATTGSDAKMNWLGTTRARVGFAADKILVYATGGFAYGGTNANTRISALNTDTAFGGSWTDSWSGAKSTTHFGWAIGAGAQYALTPNIILGGEYLFYDLGSSNYPVAYSNWSGAWATDPVFVSNNVKHTFDGSIFRVRLDYKM